MPYLYIIFNPDVGTQTAQHAWQVVKEHLLATETDYAVRTVQHPGHAIQLARQVGAFAAHKDGVMVVIGGDGTLNQAINGLKAAANNTMPIAYIPVGNDIDFALAAGISTDPLTAINQVLATTTPRTVNIGHYHELTYNKSGYFVSTLGVGLDAAVVYAGGTTTTLPFFRGRGAKRSTRFIQLFTAYFQHQPFAATIHHNQKNEMLSNLLLCNVLVHPYYAGMKLSTDGDMAANGIDIIAVRNVNLLHLSYLLLQVLLGKPKETSAVLHYHGTRLRITTNTLEFGHVDGHDLGSRMFDFDITTATQLLWQ